MLDHNRSGNGGLIVQHPTFKSIDGCKADIKPQASVSPLTNVSTVNIGLLQIERHLHWLRFGSLEMTSGRLSETTIRALRPLLEKGEVSCWLKLSRRRSHS